MIIEEYMQRDYCKYELETCISTTQGALKCLKDKPKKIDDNWHLKALDGNGYPYSIIGSSLPNLQKSATFAEGRPEWGAQRFAEAFTNYQGKPNRPLFDKGDML